MTRQRTGLFLVVVAGIVIILGGAAWFIGPRLFGGAAVAADVAPRFVDEALSAGVSHAYTGDEYYVGGGVAAFDCNSDHLADLYIAGGASPAALFVNRATKGGPLAFDAVASATTDAEDVTGAYPLDVDGDGTTDLAVLRRGGNRMLRGVGGCRFEDATQTWSFDGGNAWSTAFTAKWDPGATWPTVAVGNYLDEASADVNRLCFDNYLFPPHAGNGSGFAPPTTLTPGWCSLSMLFSDWDRSGRRDLRVSNDRHYYRDTGDGAEQLWRVEAGEAPRQYTADDGWQRLRIWGMGIATYDVNGDSYPDYYLTSQADNKLQVLADGPARPTYEDIALRRGVLATNPYEGDTNLPSTAWHDQFEDVNNDGLIDLFVAKGNVNAVLDFAQRDPSNLKIGQADGTFREGAIEAGIVDFARARGGAVVDLNNDGLLDLVVVNRIENVRLWRNVGSGTGEQPQSMGHWLAIRPTDEGSNRDAIGGWLEVRAGNQTWTRELTVGGGHVSGQLVPRHFGLGSHTSAQVRVTWPDGEVGPWLPVRADETWVVTRGATEATLIQ